MHRFVICDATIDISLVHYDSYSHYISPSIPAVKSMSRDGSPTNSNKEQSAGTGQNYGDGDVHRIQEAKNQGDTSASDSDSDSDSDLEEPRNTSHPTSPLNFPPRISDAIKHDNGNNAATTASFISGSPSSE